MVLILIVDDSPTEVHVMCKVFEKHGYKTAAAVDGAEGVRLAREMAPDLIFMDIVMPGITTSMKIRSGVISRAMRTPSAPSAAVAVW